MRSTATTAGNKRKLSTRKTRKKTQNKKKNNSSDNPLMQLLHPIDVEEECHDGLISIIDESSGIIYSNETCEQTSSCESVSITSSTSADNSIEKMEVDDVPNGCDTEGCGTKGCGTNEVDIDGRGTEGCGTCNDDVMESEDAVPVDLTEKDEVPVDATIDEVDSLTCIPESPPEDSVTSTTVNNSRDDIEIGGREDLEEGEEGVDEGDDTPCIVVTGSSQEGSTSPFPSGNREIKYAIQHVHIMYTCTLNISILYYIYSIVRKKAKCIIHMYMTYTCTSKGHTRSNMLPGEVIFH